MTNKDAQHIKDLLESSELSNRRLAIMMLSEMDNLAPIIDAFEQEDKVLLIKKPADLKKYITSEAFKQDENWTVWEDSGQNYTFRNEHPLFVVYKSKKRLKIEGLGQWEGKWESLRELITLTLSANNFQELPVAIGQFRRLEQLELIGNDFPIFPAELLQLPRLKVLRFSSNKTTELAPEMIHPDCMFLDLSNNNLTAFPGTAKLKFLRLSTLLLNNNKIEDLGGVIADFDSLRSLDLSMNPLTELPIELYTLSNLGSLNLEGTRLTTLSPKISQFKRLFILNLKNTAIKRLPESIKALKLKRLDISYTSMAKEEEYVQYLKKILPKTSIKHKI